MKCPMPITIRIKDKHYETVPCGKCEFCLERKRDEWSFRLKKELKESISSYFITLTYDEQECPYIWNNEIKPYKDYTGEEYKGNRYPIQTLNKRDVQLFIKRLRKHKEGILSVVDKKFKFYPIRYYAVGEYTDQYRPHYHGIFFNVPRETSRIIDRIWDKGFVKVGTVTDASIHYVTGYIMDKNKFWKGQERPFSLMSRKPGIGNDYLKKNGEFHKKNKQFYVINNGYKHNIPRYYKDRIFNRFEKDINNIESAERQDYNEDREIERLENLGLDSSEKRDKYRIDNIEYNRKRLRNQLTKTKKL